MKMFWIEEQLANAVLQYLGTKPFNEVAVLIQRLSQIQPAPEVREEVKKED